MPMPISEKPSEIRKAVRTLRRDSKIYLRCSTKLTRKPQVAEMRLECTFDMPEYARIKNKP